MFWNAKNGRVRLEDTDMFYVSFGHGNENLIILPGLGDGLTSVKGLALPLAFSYRAFAKKYKVYIFSRKNDFEQGYSTRDMAKDQAKAMELLGIQNANVLGVSQGGMIAQYLAIDYPNIVKKLVLAVTTSKQNKMMDDVISNWITFAELDDYKSLMIDTIEKSYSEGYIKKYRSIYPFIGLIGKPKDFGRFLIQAKSCTNHNAYPELQKIQCPTFVIGGKCDKIVGVNASREIANEIESCEIYIYDAYGHAAYEEASDFNERVLAFLNN